MQEARQRRGGPAAAAGGGAAARRARARARAARAASSGAPIRLPTHAPAPAPPPAGAPQQQQQQPQPPRAPRPPRRGGMPLLAVIAVSLLALRLGLRVATLLKQRGGESDSGGVGGERSGQVRRRRAERAAARAHHSAGPFPREPSPTPNPSRPPPPPQNKVFTKQQLAGFNGKGGGPLYMAILGEVFDVTAKPEFYGEGSTYFHFVGQDGTRAFVTGAAAAGVGVWGGGCWGRLLGRGKHAPGGCGRAVQRGRRRPPSSALGVRAPSEVEPRRPPPRPTPAPARQASSRARRGRTWRG
jgi:predicted heme/steroid binding protein